MTGVLSSRSAGGARVGSEGCAGSAECAGGFFAVRSALTDAVSARPRAYAGRGHPRRPSSICSRRLTIEAMRFWRAAMFYPMAQVGSARGYAAMGDKTNSAAAMQRFQALWKQAMPVCFWAGCSVSCQMKGMDQKKARPWPRPSSLQDHSLFQADRWVRAETAKSRRPRWCSCREELPAVLRLVEDRKILWIDGDGDGLRLRPAQARPC